MERLTLKRRPKIPEKATCLPDGDGLPVWSSLPLDAKLPMTRIPKGSVTLCTTQLGQPKHRSKQEVDFDLRDPCGKYISSEYQPLHDPHLQTHFSSQSMLKHLYKKGFISNRGKVLCSLRELNQYRQYLRHICLLEIVRERQKEVEENSKQVKRPTLSTLRLKPSKGVVVRRRMSDQRSQALDKLNHQIAVKDATVERRLKEMSDAFIGKVRLKRQEDHRKLMGIVKAQRDKDIRNQMLIKKWRHQDRLKARLIEERERHRVNMMELKCLEKWQERKEKQKEKLIREEELLTQDDEMRFKSLCKREKMVTRQRSKFEAKIEQYKEKVRREHLEREETYAQRLAMRLMAKDGSSRSKKNDLRRSVWKIEETLNKLSFTDLEPKRSEDDETLMTMINTALDDAVDLVTKVTEEEIDKELKEKAKEIVQGVITKVTKEIYPAYLHMLGDEEPKQVQQSHSVRFTEEPEQIPDPEAPEVNVEEADSSHFRPVTDHVVTPVPSHMDIILDSQMDIHRMEAAAILGSPIISGKTSTVSFVETLLLRLLDDLNNKRLSKDDIMKLASYSMDILKSSESEKDKETEIIMEETDTDTDREAGLALTSSSSILANQMVNFTLNKILDDIQSGRVQKDDLTALTMSVLDSESGDQCASLSMSEGDLDEFMDTSVRNNAPGGRRPTSPVCEALLNDFMVNTLQSLIGDLAEKKLSSDQIEVMGKHLKEEAKKYVTKDIDASASTQQILSNILDQLEEGSIDMQTLYHIVFAVAQPYSMLSISTTDFEERVTKLMKELLEAVERHASAGNLADVNLRIIQQASETLSQNGLSLHQIQGLAGTIISKLSETDKMNVTPSSDAAVNVVENTLIKAKHMLEGDGKADLKIAQSVESIASTLVSAQCGTISPSLFEVFLNILRLFKQRSEDAPDKNNVINSKQMQSIIQQISEGVISERQVLNMATTVAKAAVTPVKSETSFIANLAVKDVLTNVLDDIVRGEIESDILFRMLENVEKAYSSIVAKDSPAPMLQLLSSFLKDVLGHVAYKVQCGEFDDNDIRELSETLRETVNKSRQGNTKEELVVQLLNLVDELDGDEIGEPVSKVLGHHLIECGKRLVSTFGENESTSDSTDLLAEDIVTNVLKTIQSDIDSGDIQNDVLKSITKTYIEAQESKSSPMESINIPSTTVMNSEVAEQLVNLTIKGIHKDVERGIEVQKISSVPSVDYSPSASTIADHIVKQTIECIKRDMKGQRLPRSMLVSIASSFECLARDETTHTDKVNSVATDMKKIEQTMKAVITCLKSNQLGYKEAQKMFCMILEGYQTYMLQGQTVPEENLGSLSDEDDDLVTDLVRQTLSKIERGMQHGTTSAKQYSLPSASDNSTLFVDELVEATLKQVKEELGVESRTQKRDISDFILEIVSQLLHGLVDGSISKLSMAHFFQVVSGESQNNQSLENEAEENLSRIILDIKKKRMHSKYLYRIIDTYLTPEQPVPGVFSDPVRAIEAILMNVSEEILTKFVRATLQNILYEMQDGNVDMTSAVASPYVLQKASSIMAESVVNKVVARVRSDMSPSMKNTPGCLSRNEFERAASSLVRSPKGKAEETDQHECSESNESNLSAEVENIVLECLHNIVSNLRLEGSLFPSETDGQDTSSVGSYEIQEFVLQSLQNIVTDLQDKRALGEMGVSKTAKRADGSVSDKDCGSVDKSETSVYVNEVLAAVVHELKQEVLERNMATKISSDDIDSSFANLESTILDNLQSAVSDHAPAHAPPRMVPEQSDDVKKIVIESMRKTIENLQGGHLNEEEITTLSKVLIKYVESEDDSNEHCLPTVPSVTSDFVVELIERVLGNIESSGIDDQTIQRIALQLATLGLDQNQSTENKSSAENDENVSVSSSMLSNLVKDVLTHITQHLSSSDVFAYDIEDRRSMDANTNQRVSASSSKTDRDINMSDEMAVLPISGMSLHGDDDIPHSEQDSRSFFIQSEKANPETTLKGQDSQKNAYLKSPFVKGMARKIRSNGKPRENVYTIPSMSGKKELTEIKQKSSTQSRVMEKQKETKFRVKDTEKSTAFSPGYQYRKSAIVPVREASSKAFQKSASLTTKTTATKSPSISTEVRRSMSDKFDERISNKSAEKKKVPSLKSHKVVKGCTSHAEQKTYQTDSGSTSSGVTSESVELKSLCGIHKTTVRMLDNSSVSTLSSSDEDQSYTSCIF